MANYLLSKNGVAAATGAAFATLHSGANQVKLIEVSIFLTTAVATSVGIIRPSNTPVATTSTLGQAAGRDAPTSTTSFDTTWSTAPTIGGNEYLWRSLFPAAVSAGVIKCWRPDAPIILAPNSWLVFWNFAAGTGAIPSFGFEWDE